MKVSRKQAEEARDRARALYGDFLTIPINANVSGVESKEYSDIEEFQVTGFSKMTLFPVIVVIPNPG